MVLGWLLSAVITSTTVQTNECWQQFVRFASGKIPDTAYLSNQRAAQNVFREWFENPTLPIGEMLREAHRKATAAPYSNIANKGVDAASVKAGQWRTTSIETHISGPILQDLANLLPMQRVMTLARETTRGVIYSWSTELRGLHGKQRPSNQTFYGDGSLKWIIHHYPDVDIENHLSHAENELNFLRLLLRRRNNEQGLHDASHDSDDTALTHIAKYYYSLIHLHPFIEVNNSILMGQVNFLLTEIELNPVSHGHLDYWAIVMEEWAFVPQFIRYVKRFNDASVL